MQRLKVENYNDFLEQREEALWLLKNYIVNRLKSTEQVEFVNVIKPNTKIKNIEIVLHDEIYRTVVGRLSIEALTDRIISSFKEGLKNYDLNVFIMIKNVSIDIEETNDLA